MAIIIRRRLSLAAWAVLRILGFVIATILTRRLRVKTLFERWSRMSDTQVVPHVQAPTLTKTLAVKVEKANKGGIFSEGTWYNYGRVFKDEPLSKDAAGKTVVLSLVQSLKDSKWYIRSFQVLDTGAPEATPDVPPAPEPAPEEAGPGDESASPEALKYAEDLALKAGLTSDQADLISRIRFKKPFGDLSKREASMTIVYLGGYTPSRGRSPR